MISLGEPPAIPTLHCIGTWNFCPPVVPSMPITTPSSGESPHPTPMIVPSGCTTKLAGPSVVNFGVPVAPSNFLIPELSLTTNPP